MKHKLIGAALGLLILTGGLLAFDAVGTLQKVDPDKGILYVHANGQDRTVKVAKDAKVLDVQGKELKEGLRAKQLKQGAEVTLTQLAGAGTAGANGCRSKLVPRRR